MIKDIMIESWKLDGKRKKWLKKNKHKLSVDSIAKYLGKSPEETKKILGIKQHTEVSGTNEKYILIALLAFVFIVFATSLRNEFLSDDIPAILNNPIIKTWGFVTANFWGVIQNLIYFLIANLVGLKPWAFRLVNIASHVATTFFLFKIVARQFGFKVGILSCALFAFAPAIVEPVVWISAMPYVLGGMFTMWVVNLHLSEEQNTSTKFAEIMLWLMAMITTEKFIFIPIVLFIWDAQNKKLRENIWNLGGLFAISLIKGLAILSFFGLRVNALATSYYFSSGGAANNPLKKIVVALGNYIYLYFWPQGLTLYHSDVGLTWPDLAKYGGVLVIFCLLIWLLRKKILGVSFWLIFSLLSLIVVLSPFNVSSLVAERYAYLAHAGLAVTVALVINFVIGKVKEKEVAWTVVYVLVFAIAARSLFRIYDWRTADTLWLSAEKYSPSSWQNHNNLGDTYSKQGNITKAIEEFTKAITLNPNYADAIHNRASAYLSLGEIEKARQGFLEASRINPYLWQSNILLATTYVTDKNWKEAIKYAEKAYIVTKSPEMKKWIDELYKSAEEVKK